MANKFRCITCALLGDGTDGYKVKLRSDEGEVIDGTSSKELTPDEYYSTADVKVIQRTQTPRPNSAETANDKANPANDDVDDITTENATAGDTNARNTLPKGKVNDEVTFKKSASKKTSAKAATKKAGNKK